ncbi:MAG: Short-chain dehydrogenase/reductase family oxidoreductase [Solirubrobacterales bacterium]|jgi:NADP-dependent 3-hydroxy acid dehydrogenase YdfG|nr:Short-chain dehydrogenase/reductase family oxidoreductase [Solirubrobacterales bacterium]
MRSELTSSGRVVAITGGGRGIGLATAKALLAGGCRVVLGDIDLAVVEAAAAGLGPGAHALHLDVTDDASFDAFLAAAARDVGPVDVLVNNAGIMPIGPFLDEAPATARRAVDINLGGCLNGMRAALPAMLARGSGHVVNVASVAGRSPVPGGLTYAATKAAVISATETARVEFAGQGVAFTCVMPSFTNTDIVAGTKGTRFVKNVEPEEVGAAIAAAIASRRKDVYVPAAVGAIVKLTPLIGRRLRDATNKAIGADRAFLDVDQGARAAYENRIAPASVPPQLEPPPGVDGER